MNHAINQLQKIKHPIKWIMFIYLGFVGISLLLWLITWLLSAICKVPDLAIGLKFIDQLTNMTSIGFICFVAGCFIDLNNNGIPDTIENKIDIKKPFDNLLGLRPNNKTTQTHPDHE